MSSGNTTETQAESTTAVESNVQEQTNSTPAQGGQEPTAKKIAAGETPAKDIAGSGEAGEKASVIPPAYTPNYKFKVGDKSFEFDPKLREFIKSEEQEKLLRDVHTKAYGLDEVKKQRDIYKQELSTVGEQYRALDKDVSRVLHFAKNKDFDNFFRSLRISDQDIYQWVKTRLDLHQATPEQRQAYEQQVKARQSQLEYQDETQFRQQQYMEQSARVKELELRVTLQEPSVSQVQTKFDSEFGEGAFRELVIKEGITEELRGVELPVQEAVSRVMNRFGKWAQKSTEVEPVQPAPTVSVTSKPVIPVVQGRGTSPVKKVPKSLEDLKSLANEANQREIESRFT